MSACCREFLGALVDYLDGALPLMHRTEIDEHMNACVRCRILCETTRRTVELYKKAACCGVPLEVETRLMSALAMKSGEGWRAGGTGR